MGVRRAPGLVVMDGATEEFGDGTLPGTASDVDGGSHPVAEARCACGCTYLYAADDLALFWEPGRRFSDGCSDRSCECHVAPLRG